MFIIFNQPKLVTWPTAAEKEKDTLLVEARGKQVIFLNFVHFYKICIISDNLPTGGILDAFDNVEDYWEDFDHNSYDQDDYKEAVSDESDVATITIETPTVSALLEDGEVVFVCETSTVLTVKTRYETI